MRLLSAVTFGLTLLLCQEALAGQPSKPPTARFTMDKSSGFSPLTVNFDASTSSTQGGASVTITNYHWDFGDASVIDTASATTSHIFNSVGNFIVTLTVTDSNTLTASTSNLVIVGDLNAGDGDLYISKAALTVDWAKHAANSNGDKLTISGAINPAGLSTDPTGLNNVTVTISVNGKQIATGLLGPKGTFASASGVAPLVKYKLLPKNGAFQFSVSSTDLRAALSVSDINETRTLNLQVDVNITGGTIIHGSLKGVFSFAYTSVKGKKGVGIFTYIKNPTLSGEFISLKTKAIEDPSMGFKVSASGALLGDTNYLPLIATDGITLTIGDVGGGSGGKVILIPLNAIDQSSGSPVLIGGLVPELSKFAISNSKKTFLLATNVITGTGIPLAGDAAPLIFEMPLVIDVPTAVGTFHFSTTVEILRTSATSKSWAR